MSIASIWRSIAFGASAWFAVALVIRFMPGLFAGSTLVILYAAMIPIAYVFVPLTARVAGVTSSQSLQAVVIFTATATILDGLALAFAPVLYGGVGLAAHNGAAWLLWGYGLFLAFAYFRGRKE